MILHLKKDIPSALLVEEAARSHARYHLNGAHYVYVLGAAHKEVPELLKPYVEASFVMETDRQLSSRSYCAQLRKIEIAPDLCIDEAHTLLVAGPCSVESEVQLDQVAAYLQGLGVRVLRAGGYKPRTSPYSFQGLGAEALRLLSAVREKYGLRIITEARDATHIEAIIEQSDIVQIGAKAMYDHGILRACAQSSRPVLLKRGFGATLQELLQASEFILCEGNMQVMLCERGIRTFEQKTRFTLDLCGVAYLRSHSNLPIFVDPSHAMGHAYGVPDLSRAAAAMGVEGLLIEVHPAPQKALSDAAQQLDFAAFSALHATLPAVTAAVGRKLL